MCDKDSMTGLCGVFTQRGLLRSQYNTSKLVVFSHPEVVLFIAYFALLQVKLFSEDLIMRVPVRLVTATLVRKCFLRTFGKGFFKSLIMDTNENQAPGFFRATFEQILFGLF